MAKTAVLEEFKTPKECSLYRALRWVAFKEKIIDEDTAKLRYLDRFDMIPKELTLYSYKQKIWVAEWHSLEDKRTYEGAISKLQTKLFTGEISATGKIVLNDNYEFSGISKKFWSPSANIDWIKSEARNSSYELKNEKDKASYSDIRIETAQVFQNFPQKENNSRSSAGRKTDYDWHKIVYPEIVAHIHEKGFPESQSELARVIYEECCKQFDEADVPEIESIRKLAISPIYQRHKAGNN